MGSAKYSTLASTHKSDFELDSRGQAHFIVLNCLIGIIGNYSFGQARILKKSFGYVIANGISFKKKKLARWLAQIAPVATFFLLLCNIHFLKFMHTCTYIVVACCTFPHHVPCTGSTNLLLQVEGIIFSFKLTIFYCPHHPLESY